MRNASPGKRKWRRGGPWGVACIVIAVVGLPVNFALFAHYSAKYPDPADFEGGLSLSGMSMRDWLIMVIAFSAMFAGFVLCFFMAMTAGHAADKERHT